MAHPMNAEIARQFVAAFPGMAERGDRGKSSNYRVLDAGGRFYVKRTALADDARVHVPRLVCEELSTAELEFVVLGRVNRPKRGKELLREIWVWRSGHPLPVGENPTVWDLGLPDFRVRR